MLAMLIAVLADVARSALPTLVNLMWEKAHAPTTAEDAAPDDARRQRLLDRIHAHDDR